MDCNTKRQGKFIYKTPFRCKAIQSPHEYSREEKEKRRILFQEFDVKKATRLKDFRTWLTDGTAQKSQRSDQSTGNKDLRKEREGGRKEAQQRRWSFERGGLFFLKRQEKKDIYRKDMDWERKDEVGEKRGSQRVTNPGLAGLIARCRVWAVLTTANMSGEQSRRGGRSCEAS